MIRKKDELGDISGHYPVSVVEKIILIEEYKSFGKNKEEINKILKDNTKESIQINTILSKIKQININYIFIIIIVLGLFYEILKNNSFNEKKELLVNEEKNNIILEKRITESGINFIQKNQNIIFVPASSVSATSIIMLTFFNNIGYNNNFYIKEIKPNQGFYIQTNYPVQEESKFNWIIVE